MTNRKYKPFFSSTAPRYLSSAALRFAAAVAAYLQVKIVILFTAEYPLTLSFALAFPFDFFPRARARFAACMTPDNSADSSCQRVRSRTTSRLHSSNSYSNSRTRRREMLFSSSRCSKRKCTSLRVLMSRANTVVTVNSEKAGRGIYIPSTSLAVVSSTRKPVNLL